NSRSFVLNLTCSALELLKSYPWPGNIRELQNIISYAVTMAEGPELDIGDLPERLRAGNPSQKKQSFSEAEQTTGFYSQVLAFEAELLKAAIQKPFRSVSELAEKLGMDRSHLYTKLKQHGLRVEKK
ncbi:hypothetical protein EBZ37_10515, partial [bacterium]|nr:hypothetical protein [bacterium]